MLHAVIGIGSNSTRLLIGEIIDGQVHVKRRLREGVRLFAGLSNGMLTEESVIGAANAVAGFARVARDEGAEDIRIIATSAARDAGNGALLLELVEAMCGVAPTILSGEDEARLSFMGAAGYGFCGLIDIGGGSTELAVGGGGRPTRFASAQLGAVRLLGEYPDLSGECYERALQSAMKRVSLAWEEGAVGRHGKPPAWYAVGGTLTCLASMDKCLPAFDREAVEGYALTRGAVEEWARKLAEMSPEGRAEIPGIFQYRADIIAHGAIILLAAMKAIDIERVVVSGRSNLDGVLYEIAAGEKEHAVHRVKAFYDASVEQEWARLEKYFFEFEINRRYMDRYIKRGDRVLDVGGGPGRYSLYLAERGADVTLLDLSEGNVCFAQEKAKERGVPLKAVCGDARRADEAVEGLFDTVLLMGPLYHLEREADRVKAVESCLRLLKPGGVLMASFISMIGGMIYAARDLPESILWEGEETFYEKVIADEDFSGLAFTHAHFIAPKNVLPFMARFPLTMLHLVGSEGITAPFAKSIAGQSPEVVAKWLALSLALCEREDFRNFAEHFLYIGKKG